jgi:hypothetical protein
MGSFTRCKLISSKKAQGFEAWFFVIVALLAIALFLLVMNMTWSKVKPVLEDGLNGAMPEGSGGNVSTVLDQTSSSGLLFDKLIPFLIIGLFAFILIMAGTIIKHPIMIFVGIIILGIVILVAVIYSNIYNNISETTEFEDTKTNMPIQDKFMRYLPVIVFIMAIGIIAGIVYSRSGGSSVQL